MRWQGIFAGLTTPFDAAGRFASAAHERNIEHVLAGGVHGVIALAIMGEGPSLSGGEARQVARATVQAVASRVPVLATIGGPNERESRELARAFEASGVTGLMVLPPYFYPVTRAELIGYFRRIGATTGLPLMLYNAAYSGCPLTPEVLEILAEDIPNVVAVKEGNQLQASEVVHRLGKRLDVLAARDIYLQELVAAGGAGATSFAAAVVPDLVCALYQAALSGDTIRARELQRRLNPLVSALVRRSFPAGVKAALDLAGLYGGPTRPPLSAYEGSDMAAVAGALRALQATGEVARRNAQLRAELHVR